MLCAPLCPVTAKESMDPAGLRPPPAQRLARYAPPPTPPQPRIADVLSHGGGAGHPPKRSSTPAQPPCLQCSLFVAHVKAVAVCSSGAAEVTQARETCAYSAGRMSRKRIAWWDLKRG